MSSTPPMSDHKEEQHKHVAFWVAVSGTAAVVVALWVMILPTQLQRIRMQAQDDRSRWGVVTEEGESVKPLGEILDQQRAKLDEIEQRVIGERTKDDAESADRIRELRAKIEEASQKNELPEPEEIPAPAN